MKWEIFFRVSRVEISLDEWMNYLAIHDLWTTMVVFLLHTYLHLHF